MSGDRSHIDAIRRSVSIVDLVSSYTVLTSSGTKMKGLSPFTGEKTPSFFVDPDQGLYYCFSSQKGGDIFSFVQEMEGVDFKGALSILADIAGVRLTSAKHSSDTDDRSVLYHLLESAAAVYCNHLTDAVTQYLVGRGITEQSIAVWRIGYAPDRWNTLCDARTPRLAEHVKAGMCVQKEKSVYDRFRGRIQFPFFDERGRVIGFSGRLYGDSAMAKYINSPESPVFSKSSFLFGLYQAKSHIRKYGFSILTEGPIDAIMVHQVGYPVAVATSGTSVTETHLRLLQRLSHRLLIMFDADAAGMRATLRIIEMAFALRIESKVVVLPDGQDPADVISTDPACFRAAVRDAQPAVSFLKRYVDNLYGTTINERIRGVQEVIFPVIASVADPMVQQFVLSEIASFCGLDVSDVRKSVEHLGRPVQESFAVLKQAEPEPDRTMDPGDKKVQGGLRFVALALDFLTNDASFTPSGEIKDLLEQVRKHNDLPVMDSWVLSKFREHCNEQFSTNEVHYRVQEELASMLRLLCRELKKREVSRMGRVG